MVDQIWSTQLGDGPLVATAIHEGHAVREEIEPHFLLTETDRQRVAPCRQPLATAVHPATLQQRFILAGQVGLDQVLAVKHAQKALQRCKPKLSRCERLLESRLDLLSRRAAV